MPSTCRSSQPPVPQNNVAACDYKAESHRPNSPRTTLLSPSRMNAPAVQTYHHRHEFALGFASLEMRAPVAHLAIIASQTDPLGDPMGSRALGDLQLLTWYSHQLV